MNEEVLSAVEQMNEFYQEKTKDIDNFPFAMVSCGYYTFITYWGAADPIWSESDDGRKFIEEKNEYEPLVNFLVREVETFNKRMISYKGMIKNMNRKRIQG